MSYNSCLLLAVQRTTERSLRYVACFCGTCRSVVGCSRRAQKEVFDWLKMSQHWIRLNDSKVKGFAADVWRETLAQRTGNDREVRVFLM